MGGLATALFVVSLLVANHFAHRDRAVGVRSLGMDFIAFYTAGTFVREGWSDELYDLDAKRAFQRGIADEIGLEIGNAMGPWWNPPFYAWVFVELSRLPYPTATGVWVAINVACVVMSVLLLSPLLTPTPQPCLAPMLAPRLLGRGTSVVSKCGLVLLLTLVSMPFMGMVSHAQNSGTSLLLLTLVALAWRSRQAFAAGAVCGMLFYKPQLGALVAGMLVLSVGRRAFIGLALSGLTLLLVNLVTLPGTLADYVQRMPRNLHVAQNALPYLWDRHVTFKAFWRLLVQGPAVGEPTLLVQALSVACAGALAIGLLMAWWRSRRETSPDRLITATILAMPLIMPFYFDYDLLLLVVPAVLLAREALVNGQVDRWLVRAWLGLYVWLMVNSHVAAATRVNGTVLVLSSVAGLSIIRACRREALTVADEPPVLPQRAAA